MQRATDVTRSATGEGETILEIKAEAPVRKMQIPQQQRRQLTKWYWAKGSIQRDQSPRGDEIQVGERKTGAHASFVAVTGKFANFSGLKRNQSEPQAERKRRNRTRALTTNATSSAAAKRAANRRINAQSVIAAPIKSSAACSPFCGLLKRELSCQTAPQRRVRTQVNL